MRRRGLSLTNGRCGVRRLRGENATRRPSNSRVLMAGVVWGKWRGNEQGRGAVGQRVWHGSRPSGYCFRLCARSLSPRQRWAFAASPRCCVRCRSACGRRVEPSRWKRGAKSAPFFVKNRGLFVESGSLFPRRQGTSCRKCTTFGRRALLRGAQGRPSSRGAGAIVERQAVYRWSRGWLIR